MTLPKVFVNMPGGYIFSVMFFLCAFLAAAIAGGIIGVGAFFVGIPGPLNGLLNTDLALLIAYTVSAVVLYTVSVLDKEGQKQNIERGVV